MFRGQSTRLEMLARSQKVEQSFDLHMTLAPRVASNEYQMQAVLRKVEGLEARLSRELQRRRMEESPPEQHRQLGQLPPPSAPQFEAIDDEAPARVTIGALDLSVPQDKLRA